MLEQCTLYTCFAWNNTIRYLRSCE